MKKYLFRILVGLMAFGIGVSVLLILEISQNNVCHFVAQDNSKPEISELTNSTTPNEKIEVKFVGFGRKENRPTLKIMVTNQTSFPINYSSELLVKFNGKKIQKRWNGGCYFEEERVVNSIESVISEVFIDAEILEAINQKGKFEFGHTFFFSHLTYSWQIWSEPITISTEMKNI